MERWRAFTVMLYLLAPVSAVCVATAQTFETKADCVEVHRFPGQEGLASFREPGRKIKEIRRSGPWIKAMIYGIARQEWRIRGADVAPMSSDIRMDSPDARYAENYMPTVSKTNTPKLILVIMDPPQDSELFALS